MTLLLTVLTAVTAWADFTGSGTQDDPYQIKSANDLLALSEQSLSNDFEGVYFQLENNIAFNKSNSNNFSPIASGDYYFQGILDGDGYTISGIRIETTNPEKGLFGSIGEKGVVKNLKVADTEIKAYNMSGIIASYSAGVIENCYVGSDVLLHAINPNGSMYGGIAGLVRGGRISHCLCEASITLKDVTGGYNSMGGIVGELNGGTIENNVFTGSMQISTFSMSTNNFAILGRATSGTIRNNYYTNGSLNGAYNNISLAYTVTVPSQFVVSGESGNPESIVKGVLFDDKFYIESGATFYVFPATPNGTNTFGVNKTSDNTVVQANATGSFVMPAYDITLVYNGPWNLTVFQGDATSQYCPAYIYYFDDFSRSQFVIPASDLVDMNGKAVTAITFYTTDNNLPYTSQAPVDVYLKEVNYTSISNYETKESSTITYQGTLSIVRTNNVGQLTIEFDTPYFYHGGNLLVGIENTSCMEYRDIKFYGQVVNDASIAGYGNSLAEVAAEQRNFIPMTTFTYSNTALKKPKNLMVSNVTTNSADLNWTGYSDAYNIKYRRLESVEVGSKEGFDTGCPEGWEVRLGYLNNVMSTGNFEDDWNRWKFDTGNNVFDKHAITNNCYKDHRDWLITSPYSIGENACLNFDLALTSYFGAPQTDGVDDRFVVLASTDNMSTWTILREWNNGDSEYVYNDISFKGENITIDLSSFVGQNVRIAFYAESTVQNADNYIHIDNVAIGRLTIGTEWQTTTTNDAAITLTGLMPGARYEVKVQGDYGTDGLTSWTNVSTFTTLCDIMLSNNGTDNNAIIDAQNGKLAKVTLADRTLYKDGDWNTLVLPFDLQLDGSVLDGAEARKINEASITGSTLNMSFSDPVTSLQAGVPYIIKWSNGSNITNPEFSGVTISNAKKSYDNQVSGDTRVRFLGTYDAITYDDSNKDGVMLLGAQNKLHYVAVGAAIGACRAFFQIGDDNASARRLTDFNIDFGEGETTGIIEIFNIQRSTSNVQCYDLKGRKVANPTKGLYIVNGKKVVK